MLSSKLTPHHNNGGSASPSATRPRTLSQLHEIRSHTKNPNGKDKGFWTVFNLPLMYQFASQLKSEHRQDIVDHGFGCLLHLPHHYQMSRKFYCWMLCKINTEDSTIADGRDARASLTREQVHSLTSLPMGPRHMKVESDTDQAEGSRKLAATVLQCQARRWLPLRSWRTLSSK